MFYNEVRATEIQPSDGIECLSSAPHKDVTRRSTMTMPQNQSEVSSCAPTVWLVF